MNDLIINRYKLLYTYIYIFLLSHVDLCFHWISYKISFLYIFFLRFSFHFQKYSYFFFFGLLFLNSVYVKWWDVYLLNDLRERERESVCRMQETEEGIWNATGTNAKIQIEKSYLPKGVVIAKTWSWFKNILTSQQWSIQ